jgi:hypothetical protein
MRNLTVSIPHRLGRAEARRRLQEEIPRFRSQLGAFGQVHERWDGDTMSFTGAIMGATVSGQLFVEDEVVRLEVELPWALAMIAGGFKQSIENEGRKLLESR